MSFGSTPSLVLAALLICLPAAPVHAGSDAQNPCNDFEAGLHEGLLDPFKDEATRDRRASLLQRAVDSGCALAIHVAAGLHTLGDDHPARLVVRDLDAAERGFLHQLEQGDLSMFSRLSYLASARGDWEAAMGWAQLAGRVATSVERRMGHKSQAEATRLLALFAERPGSGEAEAKAALAALMEARGDAIRKGLAAYDDDLREPRETANGVIVPDPRNHGVLRSMPPGDYKHAQMMYVVGVDRGGRVAQHWWFDAVPDARLAESLGGIVGRFRFNRDDGAAPIRWGIQPIAFNNGEFGLGHGGNRLTRRDANQDGGPH